MKPAHPSVALRNHLIDTAATLVVAGGWPSLSIRKLGAAAGLCRTDVNDVFQKSGLIAALIDRAFGDVMIVVGHPGSICPNLAIAGARLTEDRKSDPDATCLMALLAIEARLPAGLCSPWMGDHFEDRLKQTSVSLAALCRVTEGQAMAVLDDHIATAAGMTATTRRTPHNPQQG